jgi:hypothetical protein
LKGQVQEKSEASVFVGQSELNDAVEAPRAREGGVEGLDIVRRCDHENIRIRAQTVEAGQELCYGLMGRVRLVVVDLPRQRGREKGIHEILNRKD